MASTDNDEDMNENIIHDNEDGDDDNEYKAKAISTELLELNFKNKLEETGKTR